MYSSLGITRDDKPARFEQAAKNMFFFGAPVGLIVTMDRRLCESQMLDIGLFVQNILLLAQERGLATCPQASWTMWSGIIREVLDIEENEMVMVGISLGYAAIDAPVNHLSQPRLDLDAYASLRGFSPAGLSPEGVDKDLTASGKRGLAAVGAVASSVIVSC